MAEEFSATSHTIDSLSSGRRHSRHFTSDNGENLSPNTPAYFRGFYDAERRRPRSADVPGLNVAITQALFLVLPALGIIWLGKRASKMVNRAMKNDENGGFMKQFADMMRQGMDPLSPKDFELKVRDVKFSDVLGINEAKKEVQQYVDFLKHPQKFIRLGGRVPKGCLLTGDPGTGKTLLAKAVAGEANVPFFSCSGSDFIEIFAGSGPRRVRELFGEAKKNSPSIIFIDEVDAVGRRENKETSGNVNSEENRTVNQILAELDGLKQEETVIVFAATNFPENLDAAMLREGRFDRKVHLSMPNLEARVELLQYFLKKIVTGDSDGKLETREGEKVIKFDSKPGVSNKKIAEQLATLTPNCSPATLSTIVNEGTLLAAVEDATYVEPKHLISSIDDVIMGKKHRNRMSDATMKRIALHESGHTLVAWMQAQQSPVIKVSITPRGPAAGYTQQLEREVMDALTDTMMFTDICVMLGGRAAEQTQYNTLTTGASDDYQRATKSAIAQCLALGMNHRVGLLAFDPQRMQQGRLLQYFSDEIQAEAEKEANRLVECAYKTTEDLIHHHQDKLKKLADCLFEKKELLQQELLEILGPRPTETKIVHPLVDQGLMAYRKGQEESVKEVNTVTANA